MENSITVVGIDPGLVHTGVVKLSFDSVNKQVTTQFWVVDGINPLVTMDYVYTSPKPNKIFIEKYEPRSNFETDQNMVTGVAELKATMPLATLMSNAGARVLVKPTVMKLLKVWSFDQSTHHDDLRSAARILIFGMMRDKNLNPILANFIKDHLDDVEWTVNVV